MYERPYLTPEHMAALADSSTVEAARARITEKAAPVLVAVLGTEGFIDLMAFIEDELLAGYLDYDHDAAGLLMLYDEAIEEDRLRSLEKAAVA